MKLSKVIIQNYKSISETTLDLTQSDNIVSLIGQNESGKSSILEAIRDYYQESFDEDSYPYDTEEDLTQNVACTFSFENEDNKAEFLQKIEDFANEKIFSEGVQFKKGILNKISDFTISFDGEKYSFNQSMEDILVNNVKVVEVESPETEKVEVKENKEFNPATLFPDVPDFLVKQVLPEFVYFEGGSCDTLPDFIAIDDLVNKKGDGWVAVSWMEKCLQELTNNKGFNFEQLTTTESLVRRDNINDMVSEITADFKTDFSQKIHGIENDKLSIVFSIDKLKKEGDQAYRDYIDFGVKTKKKALPVRMRSQGMIWFLSFWLALKSLKERKSIILVDEPDRNLHINAQKDLLNVLEKISKKYGHQIIYATHAPTLVPLDSIYRVYLVFNNKDEGTLCENILKTQIGNSKNKQEAISLVNYAIGCDIPYQNLIFKKKNVISEGMSDFMYLHGMSEILGKQIDYAIIPGVGAKGSKLNPLVGICIGYNLQWCVVIDGGSIGLNKLKDLTEGIFAGNGKTAETKIKVLDVEDIEDLFSTSDILKISDGSSNFVLGSKPTQKSNVSYIGEKRKNVFAKIFLEKAKAGKIKKDDLSKTTVSSFEKIFKFIDKALKIDEFGNESEQEV